jgi:membrane protein required for colicin V production
VGINWLDWVLIAILAYSVIQSFRRGFSREIISLVATILALLLAMWFYPTAGAWLRHWMTSVRTSNFLGFLLVLFGVMTIGGIVGSIVRRVVKAVGLSFFDRLLGAVFGLVRGVFIGVALLTAFIAFGPRSEPKTAPSAVVHSQIAPPLMKAASVVVDLAPAELKQNFREVYDEARAEIETSRGGKRTR